MGSQQKAVIACLSVCEETMLNRWIPDEDWIRQIQDRGDSDCSISNLNMGMSMQCLWQNNRATLQGMMILYNKKKVRILKNKVNKKATSFYYVLGAGKAAPAVPRHQGFYQLLWDDEDRSNRSLERLAPAQPKNATLQLTKKAKASSSMPISPEPPSNLPSSPSPPKSFKEANRIIQEAWRWHFQASDSRLS
jgi:hypothetical protein